MKKIITLLGRIAPALLAAVALAPMLASCSDSNDGPDAPSDDTAKPYCLMYYASGGDKEHDYMFSEAVAGMVAATEGTDVAVTYCIKAPQLSGSPACSRGTGAKGQRWQDPDWLPQPSALNMADPATLAEFLSWSAARFPGHRYLLIMAGHGMHWEPQFDGITSRATMYDDDFRDMLGADALAGTLRQSGLKVEALLMNSCLQGSAESLAEWADVVDYAMVDRNMLPDFGLAPSILVSSLAESTDLEATLCQHLAKIGQVNNGYIYTQASYVIKLSEYDRYLAALQAAFSYMAKQLDKSQLLSVDPPAVYGEKVGTAYYRAFMATEPIPIGIPLREIAPLNSARDIISMLSNAAVYTADPTLLALTLQVKRAFEAAAIARTCTSDNGDSYCSLSILTGCRYFDVPQGQGAETYTTYCGSRFSTLTGWGALYRDILLNYMTDADREALQAL